MRNPPTPVMQSNHHISSHTKTRQARQTDDNIQPHGRGNQMTEQPSFALKNAPLNSSVMAE